jgi:hypothetical protein
MDYISFDLLDDADEILNNPNLNFIENRESITGKKHIEKSGLYTQFANLENLKIEVIRGNKLNRPQIKLSGSLHKYWHQNNWQDFTISECKESINEICSILDITPQSTRIRSIEFGVNIETTHQPKKILNSIISKNGVSPEIRNYLNKGYLKRFNYSQYQVKIYDKSLQYCLDRYLIRFEIKVLKMQFLQTKGIFLNTLEDLTKIETLEKLREIISIQFNSIQFHDYRINLKEISNNRDRETLMMLLQANYLETYKAIHTKKAFYNRIERLENLVSKYAPDNLKNELLHQILNKWDQLNSTTILPPLHDDKVLRIYPHIVSNNDIQTIRRCLTCGRDITGQKSNSNFCSEKIFGPEVKRCRNVISNLKQHELRFYSGPLLFDVDQFLRNDLKTLKQYF